MRIQRSAAALIAFYAFFAYIFGVSAAATPKTKPAGGKGTIAGRVVLKDGGPMAGGQVIFFNAKTGPVPEITKYERTPDTVRDLDEEGRFSVDLPPGRYYLGAVKRVSGETIGPPAEGDYVWRSADKKGRPRAYTVRAGQRIDTGTSEAVQLNPEVLANRPNETTIEGTMIDMEGRPVAEAVVVAFESPSLKAKPVFISEKTDKAGRYLLRVSEGTYYLRARNAFTSGPPEPGQIMGFYGESSSAPVMIKKGERKNDVNFRVVLFPGRGPFSGDTK